MAKLTADQIEQALTQLPGWSSTPEGIRKKYELPTYPDAIAFVTRVAFAAEKADHHPDLTINYRWVTATLITHSEGGVTQKDMDMAATIERLHQHR